MKKKTNIKLLEPSEKKGITRHVCEIIVKRRAYVTADGIQVKVDQELGLPKDKWLPMVLEERLCFGN